MYEEYRIVEGGWRLPSPKSVLPETILEDTRTGYKYRACFDPANMKESNRYARKQKIFSEIEHGTAWISFLPIVGGGLKVWYEYREEGTFNILEIWDKVDAFLIFLVASAIILWVVSAIAGIFKDRYSRELKKSLKTSYYWKLEKDPEEIIEPYPDLKGLAKTAEQLDEMSKIEQLDKLMSKKLSEKKAKRDGQEPISEESYL